MIRPILIATVLGPLVVAATAPSPATDEGSRLAAFGASVAIAGNQAFVGEPRGATPGVVHVYTRTGNAWKATGMLSAPNGTPNDGFGSTIAADNTSLLVARLDPPFGSDSARGSVHVYRRQSSGQWAESGVLSLEGRPALAAFGSSIVLSGDVAYIGAPGEGNGSVYAYRRGADGNFVAAGKVPVESSETADRFGSSLAIDGDWLAVGAPGRASNKGAAIVFKRSTDGSWKQDAVLTSTRGGDNARFGSSLLLKANRLLVGAPAALSSTSAGQVGMVALFDYSPIAESWKERRDFAPFDLSPARFGAAMAWAADEIWIGAPQSERGMGRVFRVRQGADSSWSGMNVLEVADVEPGAGFAGAIAVVGDVAAIGMPSDGGGGGTVMFLSRAANGVWTSRGTFFPEPTAKTFAAVRGGEVMCSDSGKARDFECGNTSLISFLPISAIGGKRGTRMNDNWGWTDTVMHREIAILGRTDGTSFVDLTNPSNPVYLGDLPKTKGSPPSAWRDMKIYKDHVFIVSDNAGEHGMQVFDLTRLRNLKSTPQTFTPDVTYDRINSAHNIVSDEETGFMYTVGNSGGGETCGGGYHMIDVRDPKHPKFAGCFGDPKTGRAGTGYSHDAQCVKYHGPDTKYAGREICIGSNETAISVADLTDKKNPVAISRASYPYVAYAHQAWFTDDHKYLYLDDEGDEATGKGEAAKGTRTLVWDMSDLSDPILVQEHVGVAKAIDHNLYVKGDRLYEANYTSGLRILDISDPKNPKEVGFLDTHPGDDGTPSFAGAWSVYPFFKSGAIIVTSIGEGLFVVRDRSRKTVQ